MELETHSRWWKQRGRSHVNRVLRDDWNPIGWQVPEDEYAGYAGTVGRMLREGTSASDIASFLGSVRDRMGLDRKPEDESVDERVAASIASWYAAECVDR